MKDLLVLLFFIVHDRLSCERMVNVSPEEDQNCTMAEVTCDNITFFFCFFLSCVLPEYLYLFQLVLGGDRN